MLIKPSGRKLVPMSTTLPAPIATRIRQIAKDREQETGAFCSPASVIKELVLKAMLMEEPK